MRKAWGGSSWGKNKLAGPHSWSWSQWKRKVSWNTPKVKLSTDSLGSQLVLHWDTKITSWRLCTESELHFLTPCYPLGGIQWWVERLGACRRQWFPRLSRRHWRPESVALQKSVRGHTRITTSLQEITRLVAAVYPTAHPSHGHVLHALTIVVC